MVESRLNKMAEHRSVRPLPCAIPICCCLIPSRLQRPCAAHTPFLVVPAPFQARERERRERMLQENPGLRGIGPLDPEGRGSPHHLGGHKAFRIRRGDGEDEEDEDDEDEDEDSEEAGVMPTPTGTSYGFTRSGRRAAVRSTPSGRGTPVPAVLFSPQTPVRTHHL